MIVVDTNLVAYLLIEGERSEATRRAYLKDSGWVAPVLWKSEFRNVLALYIRNGAFPLEKAIEFATVAEGLVEDLVDTAPTADILELASTSQLSAYDCEFVAAAQRLDLYLVAADRRIPDRFPENAVSLEAYVADGKPGPEEDPFGSP